MHVVYAVVSGLLTQKESLMSKTARKVLEDFSADCCGTKCDADMPLSELRAMVDKCKTIEEVKTLLK